MGPFVTAALGERCAAVATVQCLFRVTVVMFLQIPFAELQCANRRGAFCAPEQHLFEG
jgi:hypothetical protein